MSPDASRSPVEQAPPRGVVALDRLSEDLLTAAGDLRVSVAESAAERDAVVRLRYRQVVRDGWAPAASLPDGVERDAWDPAALQVGAWAGAELVGAMRVVLPSPRRALPVEDAFELVVQPVGAVAEAGRLVIDPEARGDPAHRAWGALFARSWLELRARGLRVLAGAAAPAMVERLRSLGLPFEVLGPAREHWGSERLPVRLDPATSQPSWFTAHRQASR